jgi:phosphoribosylamine--glycine ligase
LAWKIAQSQDVEKLYCAPGNPGMAQHGECVPIETNDFAGLVAFAREHRVDLTVVGPEEPLTRGLADVFAEAGLKVFGPGADGAKLEGSKSFAKRVMERYGIPTAGYEVFTDPESAIAYVRARGAPVVIKADGLAAGKGVTVAHAVEKAEEAIRAAMVDRIFGSAGSQIIVEEMLVGEEASILAFSDGETVVPMEGSQDHKPVYDGDQGPNTGGMGAYSPAPVVDAAMEQEILHTILEPCVAGMADEGRPYRGVLYAGLMMTDRGPKVVEFNCRFGDPETQAVLPRMKSDLPPILMACCEGTLDSTRIEWGEGACVSVAMASGGYPGPYEKGKPISGIERAEEECGVKVFHAGTKRLGGSLVTAGGRVLNVTATGSDIADAIDRAYRAVGRIHFEKAHFRTDIGHRALARLRGGVTG